MHALAVVCVCVCVADSFIVVVLLLIRVVREISGIFFHICKLKLTP